MLIISLGARLGAGGALIRTHKAVVHEVSLESLANETSGHTENARYGVGLIISMYDEHRSEEMPKLIITKDRIPS